MELILQNISVNLGGQKILDDVSLAVREGEFVSLLGVSGSGKTTLLKTVAGIIPPSAGSVLLDGRSADPLPPHKRGAVIVFQDFRLFPHMTAAENIAFPLKMQGAGRKERLAAAEDLLKKVQMEGFDGRMPSEMSGGQVQRVALARALAARPNVLLLDEPFSNLDENLRREMRGLVRDLHLEYGTTTVLVTHDREEALSMSDRVALITRGKILQYDTPRNMYESPASPEAADYFGDTVYIPGVARSGVFKSKCVTFSADRPDGYYRAMLRPSAVRIAGKAPDGFLIRSAGYRGEGYEVVLESTAPPMAFTLRVPALDGFGPGDTVRVEFDTEKAVLFSN